MTELSTKQPIEEHKVQDFFIAVLQNETLRERLMTALDTRDDAAIMGLATEHGYDFNRESLHQGLKRIANLITPVTLTEG